jgi:hypothetical protein
MNKYYYENHYQENLICRTCKCPLLRLGDYRTYRYVCISCWVKTTELKSDLFIKYISDEEYAQNFCEDSLSEKIRTAYKKIMGCTYKETLLKRVAERKEAERKRDDILDEALDEAIKIAVKNKWIKIVDAESEDYSSNPLPQQPETARR